MRLDPPAIHGNMDLPRDPDAGPLAAISVAVYKFLLAAALMLFQLDAQAATQAPVAAENGMVVTAQHVATHGMC